MEGCTLVALSPHLPTRRDEFADIWQNAILFGEADDMDGALGTIRERVATFPNVRAVVTDCPNSFFLTKLAMQMHGIAIELGRLVSVVVIEGGRIIATYPPLVLSD